MALFGHLDDQIFLPFSRGHRWLYEKCLIAVYERFYKDSPRFPRQAEIVADLYDTLKANPELWKDDQELGDVPELTAKKRKHFKQGRGPNARQEVVDEMRRRALKIYDYLLDTGWFEEEKFGIQVTVDMTPGALALMGSLYRIKEGFSIQFSGRLVILNQTLESLRDKPTQTATALESVRRDLEDFVRHLRAILSDLKRIKEDMTNGESNKDRVRVFLEGFVKQVLLRDFAALHTTNHPYRYKHETMANVRSLSSNDAILRDIGEALARAQNPELFDRDDISELQIMQAVDQGVRMAEADLSSIESILGHIDEMFERINIFQRQLEERLRNMLRYKGRGKRGLTKKTDVLLDRLVKHMRNDPDQIDERLIEGVLSGEHRVFGEAMHYTPRKPRTTVAAAAMTVKEADPVDLFLRGLKRDYQKRIKPSDTVIEAFLERVLGSQDRMLGSEMELVSIDDFLAFDATSMMARRGHMPPVMAKKFAVQPVAMKPRVRNDYIECEDFMIRRVQGAAQ